MTFTDTSLVITHYNRPHSLKRQLDAYQDLGVSFGEIIISDDGSKAENLEQVKAIADDFSAILISTPQNKGLGHNINKGMRAASFLNVLYVQEDFCPRASFTEVFGQALELFKSDPALDIIRFYAYFKYPYLEDYQGKFKKIDFRLSAPGYKKFYAYSDHPHLRRNTFSQRFGEYAEGLNPERTEYKMMFSFLKNKGQALFYEDFKSVFEQVNTSEEPSTMERNYWRNSSFIPVRLMREAYRHIRMNIDFFRF